MCIFYQLVGVGNTGQLRGLARALCPAQEVRGFNTGAVYFGGWKKWNKNVTIEKWDNKSLSFDKLNSACQNIIYLQKSFDNSKSPKKNHGDAEVQETEMYEMEITWTGPLGRLNLSSVCCG